MIGATKLGLSSLVLLSGAIGTYGIHWYASTPKNVKDALSKEGFDFLDTNTEVKGTSDSLSYQKWKKLIGENGNNTGAKNFAKWEENEQEQEKIEKMRKKCKEALEVLYNNDNFGNSLEEAKQFCVKDK